MAGSPTIPTPTGVAGANQMQQQSPAEVCQRTLGYVPSLKAGSESGQPLSSSVVDLLITALTPCSLAGALQSGT